MTVDSVVLEQNVSVSDRREGPPPPGGKTVPPYQVSQEETRPWMPTRATAAAISTPWLMLGAHLRLDGMGRVWLWTYPGDLDGDPRCLGFTDDDRWHQWEAVCPDLGARPRWLDTEWNYLLDYWENR